MRVSKIVSPLFLIAVLLVGLSGTAPSLADPVATPGYSVELFATLDNPFHLSLDASGNLFAGRTDPIASIYRISPDGVVEEFGGPINDPDAVIVDIAGTVSTLGPGSVLVAGALSDGTRLNNRITEISPDGSTTRTLVNGSLPEMNNPQGMVIIGSKLLWANHDQTSVPRTDTVGSYDGTTLGVFGTVDVLTHLGDLAVAADGRIFVSDSTQSKVQVLSATGALLDPEFFAGPGVAAIAFDQTGQNGTDLFVAVTGRILRVNPVSGGAQEFASGFEGTPGGLDFGPEGCLYASEIRGDRIWKFCETPSTVAFDAISYRADEGDLAEVTVERRDSGEGEVWVSYSSRAGTATRDEDYIAVSGDLHWADGDTSDRTILMTIFPDMLPEPPETVHFILFDPVNTQIGEPASARLTVDSHDVYAYVPNHNDDTVTVIDASRDVIAGTIGVGPNPDGVTVTPYGTGVYVVNRGPSLRNRGDETISVIDGATGAVVSELDSPSMPPIRASFGRHLMAHPTLPFVYAIGQEFQGQRNTLGDLVWKINTIDGAIETLGQIPFDTREVVDAKASPDGRSLYGAGFGILARVPLADLSRPVIADLEADFPDLRLFGVYKSIAPTPDGSRVYSSFHDLRIDGNCSFTTSTECSNDFDCPIFEICNIQVTEPGYVGAVDDQMMAVAQNGLCLGCFIDPLISTAEESGGVVVHSDGTRVYATNIALDTVSVFDTTSGMLQASIPVGDGPFRLAAHPVRPRIYVLNTADETVSVIDTDSEMVVGTLSVGSAPTMIGIAAPVVDSDEDGIPDPVEKAAPNNGDGNNDGLQDCEQPEVGSLPNALDNSYVTVVASKGILGNVRTRPLPSSVVPPVGGDFPAGLVGFTVSGLRLGDAVDVAVLLESGVVPTSYWKYGPTGNDRLDHWYPFPWSGVPGEPGAEILGDRVTLHLVDGGLGDSDLGTNGSITDPGGPAGACEDSHLDADADGTPDCADACPEDGNKVFPGLCGCGASDSDMDGDGDEVLDCNDVCPASEFSPTVILAGCDSGVENTSSAADGCTLSDYLAECTADAIPHGDPVSCIAHLTNDLASWNVITGDEKGAIQSCAARGETPWFP